MMLFLNNAHVQQVLTMADCIRVHEEGEVELADGELASRPRIDVVSPTPNPERFYRWGTMEGTSKSLHTHAIRMKSDVVYYERHGDRIVEEKYSSRPGLYCGLVFVTDTSTGEPIALIQDGFLQHMRVGAKNALGVKYLARDDARTVGMLGSGGQAHSHLTAISEVRPIERCKVYSPTPQHRETFAREMSDTLGIDVIPVDDPREAVRGVDVVSCNTNSMAPVLLADMVEPGVHITVVSNEWAPDVLPMIDVTVTSGESRVFRGVPIDQSRPSGGAAAVYAAASDDDLARLEAISGNRHQAVVPSGGAGARFRARRVPLADLIAGRAQGRLTDDEISSSTGVGGGGSQGVSFVTVSRLVYELARERGIGTELPTDLFLQDIRD